MVMYKIDRRGGGGGPKIVKSFSRTDPNISLTGLKRIVIIIQFKNFI